jgi:putative transposase
MQLDQHLKRHRFPLSIISQAVWLYHRFNHSYRDIQEQLAFRGIILSHETVRDWCMKFADHFKDVIKKRERKPGDKWHLDEMTVKINSEPFVLWRAVDEEGIELDVFLQKRRNKKAAIRFLSRLLKSLPVHVSLLPTNLKAITNP